MAFRSRKMFDSYLQGKDLHFPISIPCFFINPPPPPPPSPLEQRDLTFLVSTSICILSSILLLLTLLFFVYLYIKLSRRRSNPTQAPNNTTRQVELEESDFSGEYHVWRITTTGLNRSDIDSITVVGFKKGQGLIDGTDCSVCLNEFEEDEPLRLLPKCNHAFHIECIDTWLLSHKNCPLCRAPILPTKPLNQQESSRSRNLQRAQSDLARHCSSLRRVGTIRRSFSIGACDSVNRVTRSRRRFYSSFSANLFSSSRRLMNNHGPVLPNQMPSVSSYAG